MMKKLSLIFVTVLCFSVTYGQKVVALNSSGSTTMFQGVNPLIDAFAAALPGDTIYLPGGNLNAPASFNKAITLIGAGYHPDSSSVTLKTTISGTIQLTVDASSSRFEGMEFFGVVQMDNNATCSNITFSRCKMNSSVNFPGDSYATLNAFSECVFIGVPNIPNLVSSVFNNCIFQSRVQNSKNNAFKNSVFLYNASSIASPLFYSGQNNDVVNNVFITSGIYVTSSNYACPGNTYYNNLFVTSSPFYGADATIISSYTGVNQNDIFVNQSGYIFDFSHDYALQDASLYPAYNTSEVGLFGGLMPWKLGAMPLNPHFQSKSISGQTDNNGQLQIEITVESQNN